MGGLPFAFMAKTETDAPEVEQTATTTKTKDYMGRALSNIATAGKDYTGRAIQASDKDWLGRSLVT